MLIVVSTAWRDKKRKKTAVREGGRVGGRKDSGADSNSLLQQQTTGANPCFVVCFQLLFFLHSFVDLDENDSTFLGMAKSAVFAAEQRFKISIHATAFILSDNALPHFHMT